MEWENIYKKLILKQTTNIQRANEVFNEYKKSDLTICFFHLSLGRLALRITNDFLEEVLYVILIATKSISGNLSLSNINLEISKHTDKWATNYYSLVDETNDFEIVCTGGFVVFEGKYDEFGDSIDSLISSVGNKPIPEL